MITIRFSHDYIKMPQEWDVRYGKSWLVGVDYIPDVKMMPKEFLDFDTAYVDENENEWGRYGEQKVSHYELPKGPVILLVVFSVAPPEDYQLWCTIRRWTQEKRVYYNSHRGEEVKIEISHVTPPKASIKAKEGKT